MFGDLPKKRGRPTTGKALTPTERKQKQIRNIEAMIQQSTDHWTVSTCLYVLNSAKYCDATKKQAWLTLGGLSGWG